jgi:hypothetical protein
MVCFVAVCGKQKAAQHTLLCASARAAKTRRLFKLLLLKPAH